MRFWVRCIFCSNSHPNLFPTSYPFIISANSMTSHCKPLVLPQGKSFPFAVLKSSVRRQYFPLCPVRFESDRATCAVTLLPSAQLGLHKFSENIPVPFAPSLDQVLHLIFSTYMPKSAHIIMKFFGLNSEVSQSQVRTCSGLKEGISFSVVLTEALSSDLGSIFSRFTASAADRRTATAVIKALILFMHQ